MDNCDLNCNIVENRTYNLISLTEYNDKSDKADVAVVSEIQNKREELENVFLTNKELNDYQNIVNDFSEIEDKNEVIENVLTNDELNECQSISEMEDNGD
ncbi:hypothetical protein BgiMline_020869 [Biomphalaria glabrata]|nr:hypothetical protein BgiMline_018044 [Biomphalaria glabrata]